MNYNNLDETEARTSIYDQRLSPSPGHEYDLADLLFAWLVTNEGCSLFRPRLDGTFVWHWVAESRRSHISFQCRHNEHHFT